VLVLLNNDTMVPPGWLSRLAGHLDEPSVGLVGAVTNRSGNEAQIEVPYRTVGEFLEFAAALARNCERRAFDIRVATMFCAAMRRDVYERVGMLDERFAVGLFEDDDYSMRVREAGYRVVCAEDTFVHHFGQVSLGDAAAGDYGALFHANRRQWEEKWGRPWEAYRLRPGPRYQHMLARIRQIAADRVPDGATVLVVSRGDDELLHLGNARGRHFPSAADGTYLGHHPSDSAAAIRLIAEARRLTGAAFLLLPESARWWLDEYPDFATHLQEHGPPIAAEPDACVIYDLRRTPRGTC
jgi:GT2 family glycosyltransferase